MKIWKNAEANPILAKHIAEEMELPVPVAMVLCSMGITDAIQIKHFLKPSLSQISDPFLLPSMEKAVSRIWHAVETHEPIAVYGDYDADGVTSTALLIRILRKLGAESISACLPNRISDGYGLNTETLNRCLESFHPKLLITVDCGTNCTQAAELAAKKNVDIIVTDHHESVGNTPDVYALVNPKKGTHEPSKMLAGVGVTFKLCHAMLKYGREHGYKIAHEVELKDYLPLVSIGTIADSVPLLQENRIMTRYGLAKLNDTKTVGLKALIKIAGLQKTILAYHVAFCLAPRLNAAGRIGNAEEALELLLTDDTCQADIIAQKLDATNQTRKEIEEKAKQEALTELYSSFDEAKDFGLVVGKHGWHPGIVGIVASRLVKIFARPVVVIAFDDNGVGRGSCRSIEGYNIIQALERCEEYLLNFGGHKQAAGMTLLQENFDRFRLKFNEVVGSELKDSDLRPVQHINSWIKLSEVDMPLLNGLNKLRPFGQDNPRPVFAIRQAHIADVPRKVGENHLRFTVESDGKRASAIAFNMANSTIPQGPVDIAFCLQKNTYSGNNNLQLNIQDIRQTQ